MRTNRRRLLTSMMAGAIAPAVDACARESDRLSLPVEGAFPSLGGATAWLGSPPLTQAGLRGKVVLIDFCTYSCINWLRTLPYVRAWSARYGRHGLAVIGVHTPEFDFEHDIGNVRRATSAMRLDYPIAIDNDTAIWRAFGNQFWPALYFIDAQGRLRHHRFGEGDEENSERVIRQLLSEAGAGDLGGERTTIDARGLEVAAAWADMRSDENYIGYARTLRFTPPGGIVPDRRHVYAAPVGLTPDAWSLAGDWTVGKSFAALDEPGGRIVYGFQARDLHIVMGPTRGGSPVRFRVLVDGRAPEGDHGLDVDDRGFGTVAEPRLYQLIRQGRPVADRLFEIAFVDRGVQVYSFAFG